MKYIPEFLQDAMEEGIEIGELRKAREAVTAVLMVRLRQVPDELQKMIEEIEDPILLEQLLEQAALANSLDELEPFLHQKMLQKV